MKPISDKWIADALKYSFNPRTLESTHFTVRKLARELHRVRDEIRKHIPLPSDFRGISNEDASLYHATLPEHWRKPEVK